MTDDEMDELLQNTSRIIRNGTRALRFGGAFYIVTVTVGSQVTHSAFCGAGWPQNPNSSCYPQNDLLPKSVKRFSDKRRGENKGLEQERDSEIAHSALGEEWFQELQKIKDALMRKAGRLLE